MISKDRKTLEELEKKQLQFIAEEHNKMPKTCSKCEGRMNFIKQVYITGPTKGDILTYRCEKCGNVVEKFIEHPPEYTKLLKDLANQIDQLM